MDAVDADMDDLFGADEAIEDNRYDNENSSKNGVTNDKDENARQVTVKRVVRNLQPKLDAERLISDKGIPKLLKSFQDVQFKGKGCEADDLDMMMAIIELWGHRMFPQFTFTDLVEKIEKLGSKRAVHVCLEKIRRDMPVCDDDFLNHADDDEDNVQREGDFDRLIAEDSPDNIPSQSRSQVESKVTPPVPQKLLTDEEKERIAGNKKMAEERRMARMNAADLSIRQAAPGPDNGATESVPLNADLVHEGTEEELMAMLDDDDDDDFMEP